MNKHLLASVLTIALVGAGVVFGVRALSSAIPVVRRNLTKEETELWFNGTHDNHIEPSITMNAKLETEKNQSAFEVYSYDGKKLLRVDRGKIDFIKLKR